MTRDAEAGVMVPQSQECWQPPEEARENSPPGPLQGAGPWWHLEFGLLASRHFGALSHQLMVLCDSSHRKLFSLKALESRAVVMFCLVAAVFWVDPSSCVMHEPLASVSPGSLVEMQTARLSPDLLNQHPHFTRSPSGSYTCSPLTSVSRENSEVTIRSFPHLPESYFLRVKSVERGKEVM